MVEKMVALKAEMKAVMRVVLMVALKVDQWVVMVL
jgi:hypothetical protein